MKKHINLNDGIRGYIDGDADGPREWSEENEREWRNHLKEMENKSLMEREYQPRKKS